MCGWHLRGPSPQGHPRWQGDRGWHRLSRLPAVLPPAPDVQSVVSRTPPSSAAGCGQQGLVGRLTELHGHARGPLPNTHHPRQGKGSPVTPPAARSPHSGACTSIGSPIMRCCRDTPETRVGPGAQLTRPLNTPSPLEDCLLPGTAPGRRKGCECLSPLRPSANPPPQGLRAHSPFPPALSALPRSPAAQRPRPRHSAFPSAKQRVHHAGG